eukprot:GFUD01012115.1.p1 GENE.GFUD01012115.1~~GFUD01012115.1.p1  ORF type:complete len:178 (-),score=58.41 GFUD01012115.1:2-535(-)
MLTTEPIPEKVHTSSSMVVLKYLGFILAMFLMFSSSMDMIQMNVKKVCHREEFIFPSALFLMAFSFLVAFIIENIMLYVLTMILFTSLSIIYMCWIFLLAISPDDIIVELINQKNSLLSSIFSNPVISDSVSAARMELLVFLVAMFFIASIISASAYTSIKQKETITITKKNQQLVV